MFEQDTICAVSTPPGEGGIGIIRISGRTAVAIADKVFRLRRAEAGSLETAPTHSLHYGYIVDPVTQEQVDEVLASVMRSPATYTREDVVEINCHGGMMPLWRTLSLLIAAGARQAEPGEFAKRAFLNGRIDLTQAEAVMDIIKSKTALAHRAANDQLLGGLSSEVASLRNQLLSFTAAVEAWIDFPEEDIEFGTGSRPADTVVQLIGGVESLLSTYNYGRILRDGFATAIVGRPNVGKSSLLNTLLKQNRAIVTDIPGTTRDLLEEYLNVAGIPLKIIDTAGIRYSHDIVEKEGIRRTLAAIESADIALVVLDGSRKLTLEDRLVLEYVAGKNAVAVINKSDLPREMEALNQPVVQVSISCITGEGLEELKSAILNMQKREIAPSRDHAWTVNLRHKTALEQTRESLLKAHASIKDNASPEFIALDLRCALDSLGIITGATYTEDILDRIFENFCIGK